jgi:hypothetical protein
MELVVLHTGRLATSASAAAWHRLSLSPAAELKICNQSELSLGRVSELSDEELVAIADDLASGALGKFAGRVDNCDCFDVLAPLAA